jgi:predicted Fe-Mo cluster-binding NifX family protein
MRVMKIHREFRDLRIGVTSRGEGPLSEVCEQFGRSYWLMIYSSEECRWYPIDNRLNRTLASGAGIATAEEMIDAGVKVVLTGETGPKAFRTLKAAKIGVVHNVSGVVEEAVWDWLNGSFSLASQANEAGSPNCLLGKFLTQKKVETR